MGCFESKIEIVVGLGPFGNAYIADEDDPWDRHTLTILPEGEPSYYWTLSSDHCGYTAHGYPRKWYAEEETWDSENRIYEAMFYYRAGFVDEDGAHSFKQIIHFNDDCSYSIEGTCCIDYDLDGHEIGRHEEGYNYYQRTDFHHHDSEHSHHSDHHSSSDHHEGIVVEEHHSHHSGDVVDAVLDVLDAVHHDDHHVIEVHHDDHHDPHHVVEIHHDDPHHVVEVHHDDHHDPHMDMPPPDYGHEEHHDEPPPEEYGGEQPPPEEYGGEEPPPEEEAPPEEEYGGEEPPPEEEEPPAEEEEPPADYGDEGGDDGGGDDGGDY